MIGEGSAQGLALKSYTPLQAHFLLRLIQLRQRRATYVQHPQAESWLVAVMDRALYATYLDCLEAGLAAAAKKVLTQGMTESRADN